MKTIDEVIKALELCTSGYCSDSDGDCPYIESNNDCDTRKRKLDALHYLKEYRRVQKRMESIALGSIEETLAKMDNPPLPWEELRQMEGKPVWVEEKTDGYGLSCYWNVIKKVEKFDIGSESILFISHDYYDDEDYGKTWQAYRKERE